MRNSLPALAGALLLSITAHAAPVSGIEFANIDPAIRVQDDLFRHVSGKWLETTSIPPDKAQYGGFLQLQDETLLQLRAIVEGLDRGAAETEDARKIRDLYRSFMDEAIAEKRGLAPLADEFARIDRMRTKAGIAEVIARFNQIGVSAPYDIGVHQDAKDSTRYIADLSQSGLGLPDRDYYLKDDDARLLDARTKYRAHVERMLALAGQPQPAAMTDAIMALETALARVQWTKVENRDPVKTYNPIKLARLPELAPGYDWKRYLAGARLAGKVDGVVVSQPSYLTGFAKVVEDAPLSTWKGYLKWRLLDDYAPYLSKRFVDERFAFNGTVLRDIPENRPRWKRALGFVESSAGEALGKQYVARHFPPERKARMDTLVANLLAAYRQSIDSLEWMGPDTKREAQAKLARFTPKIGYPVKWRDYSRLVVRADDLVGNAMRAQKFEYDRNVAKLGKPIDREEWFMSPQTVNAYYNPEMNEVVFPASILQPPFFNADADDAVNYGAIGAVIGHEISHGFDDSGSQYDGNGNLRDWWTKEDHEKFDARTKALIAQYAAYSPLPGYHLNGELTLGENIADNSGLAIAYKAYKIALGGKPAPVIDGLTGDQRFFLGWGQAWREKTREAEELRLLKIDPHAPSMFRANGSAVNQPGFYEAFGVKESDRMYVAPEKRVTIW
jgi:predicted metalloendopeptidase